VILYILVFHHQYNGIRVKKIKFNLYYAIQHFNRSLHIFTYKFKYIIISVIKLIVFNDKTLKYIIYYYTIYLDIIFLYEFLRYNRGFNFKFLIDIFF